VLAAAAGRVLHETTDVPSWAQPIVDAVKASSSTSNMPEALTAIVDTLTRK
jgi:hypothetical protein